jgi:hypothetical protein
VHEHGADRNAPLAAPALGFFNRCIEMQIHTRLILPQP